MFLKLSSQRRDKPETRAVPCHALPPLLWKHRYKEELAFFYSFSNFYFMKRNLLGKYEGAEEEAVRVSSL